jgi:hypothetical protein
MSHFTYHVGIGVDGRPAVSVSSEDPLIPLKAIPWAKETYARLTMADAATPTATPKAEPNTEHPPTCGVHGAPMTGVNGKRGFFRSCHTRDADGTWCSYRPART